MNFPSYTTKYHKRPYSAISPSRPTLSHAQKTILISGAGSGVGAATALAYAASGAAHIILVGRRENLLNETRDSITSKFTEKKVSVRALDITDLQAVRKAFEENAPVHVVVHCAGYLEGNNKIKDGEFEEFWTAMEVNVKGTWNLATALLNNTSTSTPSKTASNNDAADANTEGQNELMETDKPVFIALSSCLSHLPASSVSTAPSSYSVSKIASAKLIKYLASENPGIRAYSLHPGIIETEMSLKSLEMAPEGFASEVEWDDVRVAAHFCVWLSSGEGSGVRSGRFLWGNWDVVELRERKEVRGEGREGELTMGLVGWGDKMPEEVMR